MKAAGKVQLSRASVRGSAQGSGVLVHGAGSSASLIFCEAAENDVGIDVREGGRAEVQSSGTADNGRAGVAVDHSSKLEMSRCKSVDATPFIAPKVRGCLVRAECTPK